MCFCSQAKIEFSLSENLINLLYMNAENADIFYWNKLYMMLMTTKKNY